MKAFQYTARFIELASDINTNMPRYVVARTLDALNDRGKTLKGAKVLVLGVAYKPDIDDIRESPALDVIGLLQKKGAEVDFHDPYIPVIKTHEGHEMHSVPDLMPAVRAADLVVIVTNHKVYDYPAILDAAKFIFDSRNALGKLGKENPKVERL
jgi:UDP-N-acetyl-D-glucosamine dehydrogenase